MAPATVLTAKLPLGIVKCSCTDDNDTSSYSITTHSMQLPIGCCCWLHISDIA